ncbi:MAG: hypothetical protein LBT14_06150 [Treponema sp.]|nr:hypothetical protein [Treponema sp.]
MSLERPFRASPQHAAEFAQKTKDFIFERNEAGHINPFNLNRLGRKRPMNVSVVMKSLKPYSPALWLAELQTLLETSCQNRTLPYARETPLPHNTDVIRNIQCNDINTQTIELKAASIGIERTAWIFGADAEFLGLALREPEENGPFDPDPLLWFARIASRPETPVEAQTVYLIDQCTGESLNRLASRAYAPRKIRRCQGMRKSKNAAAL